MSDHDWLIEALSSDVVPVRRPAPAATRALAWSLVCLLVGWCATRLLPAVWGGIGVSSWFGGMEFAASLAAGMALLIAALQTSIAGRRGHRWLFAAGFCAITWLVASGADLAAAGWPLGHLGEGSYCFRFVLLACLPMAIALIIAVRRTYSVCPLRTMLLGASGISFLSFALLSCCHHGRLHMVDFSMHLVAATLVVALLVVFARRAVAIPRVDRGLRRGRSL